MVCDLHLSSYISSALVQQLATNSFSTVLEKFKEKKMNVVTVLRECVDAFYPILGKRGLSP